RVYRLLGCVLTYHGGLPEVGETLTYDIHLDGHAKQGDTRLMFFHYDCHVGGARRLSVRQGQAGFFSDAELAASDGCLWRPEDQELVAAPRLDPPALDCPRRSFTPAQVQAFAAGRPWECFGDAFLYTRAHTRTPRIQSGRMLFFDQVESFAPRGGPWDRGYLRAHKRLRDDEWFYEGHFHGDPCMPGTLMFEGCLQAMAFYLAALGYTARRDGWRFEPVPEEAYKLSCRGQVTPGARELIYEVFVEEVIAAPVPTIYADLLCTVDGLKAFHARRVGLRLVPAWPLDEGHPLLERAAGRPAPAQLARAGEFVFDLRSMLACACGRPTEAFGPIYARFDGHESVPRLPNPPYHFMSRVTRVDGAIGELRAGAQAWVELDVAPSAWYFAENSSRTMPLCVLLEAALQPCGWLASYMGCALSVDEPLMFRNLDGTGTQHAEVGPDAGVLRTRARNTTLSRTASMIIVGFEVECHVGELRVYSMETVFGFFPAAAFEDQPGLPTTAAQRGALERPGAAPVPFANPAGARLRVAAPMLRMLDRVTCWEPEGGAAGLGFARAEKVVDPGEWFFAAHFFQDPVQPGSLGIEAMIQLLQWCVRELGLADELRHPRFEPVELGGALTWKYRGQVVPRDGVITTTLELVARGRDERGAYARAVASLWIDGKRIYEATGLGVRVVDDPSERGRHGRRAPLSLRARPWLRDHRPTWTVPAVPMMSMVELLAGAARADERLIGLRDVRVKGWLTVPEERAGALRCDREGDRATLYLEAGEGAPEREIASARLLTGAAPARPAAWPALTGEPSPRPYDDGSLFHGPAFQLLERLVRTAAGASSVINLPDPTRRDAGAVPRPPIGRLHPLLLDAATHGIPHDRLELWDARLSPDHVAYPAWVPELDVYGPPPTRGPIRCEARPRGLVGGAAFPAFDIQIIDADERVWCQLRLVEACFPKGPLGRAAPPLRRAFLRDHIYVPGVSLTRTGARESVLDVAALA
ncbi:MAG: polyketide synthase dehydratase domain-containing protein, partial [Myxococcales bacterium]|nr:polyketide synthase dehydratase domain-containing protein [Myxococcales bacterium]